MEFRKLTAKEIDARVGICNGKGFSLLLYKDARCDMRILDEMNLIWQRKHYELKGIIYCSVGIWNDKLNQFVWKDDCGTEGFTEKEKSESSDSFKRSCFCWGIGRELYTAPFIYIKGNTEQNDKGQYVPSFKKFTVTEIDYNKDGEICKLQIKGDNEVIYEYGMGNNKPVQNSTPTIDDISLDFALTVKSSTGKFYKDYSKQSLMAIRDGSKTSPQMKKVCELLIAYQEQLEDDELIPIDTEDLPFK